VKVSVLESPQGKKYLVNSGKEGQINTFKDGFRYMTFKVGFAGERALDGRFMLHES